MTGSEDHRGSRGLVDLSEVSHARIAIIADLCIVERTGRCRGARHSRRITRGAGTSAGSTRSPRSAASTAGRGERGGLRRGGPLAWLTAHRRLARDYERDPEVSEEMIRWAAISQMLRRITRGKPAHRQQRRTLRQARATTL